MTNEDEHERVHFTTSSDSDNNGNGNGDNSHPKPPPSPPPPAINNLTPKFTSKALRGNLMREQVDRDPLFYYEVATVLGVGSMGSVAKVRKRDAAIGGSARKDLQDHFRREKLMKTCFNVPLVGGLFNFCLKRMVKPPSDITGRHRRMSSRSSITSSVLAPLGAVEDYNDLHGEELYQNDNLYAMKSIHLSRVTDDSFVQELKNEIHILRRLDHPHIVRAIETFEHRNQIFIVMELCSGGDLYSRDPYTEEESARITSSILSAVSYMHSKGIIHRDLKYENILFIDNNPRAEIKLIDFGLSKRFGHEDMTEGVGTVYTMAPEVLKGKYTKNADVWSIGVITYMLLSSQMPFFGRKRRHIVEQIIKGTYEFKGRRWKKLSPQSKAFVQDLLVVDPDDRLTADDALSASWLNRRYSATVRSPHEEEMEVAQQSMFRYAGYAKLKRVALMVIAHKSSSQEIGILRKVFQKYDTKRDGQLSFKEFKAAIAESGIDESEHQQIFDAVDIDGSGKIRYTEFLAATIEAQGAISEERLAEAFDRMDADDSGYISAENLKEMLGDEFPEDEIDAIIKEVDLTKNGKISYSEFLAMWEIQHEEKRSNEIMVIQSLLRHSDRSGASGASSDEDVVSRANFLDAKLHADAKLHEDTIAKETAQIEKHVVFKDDSAQQLRTSPNTI